LSGFFPLHRVKNPLLLSIVPTELVCKKEISYRSSFLRRVQILQLYLSFLQNFSMDINQIFFFAHCSIV